MNSVFTVSDGRAGTRVVGGIGTVSLESQRYNAAVRGEKVLQRYAIRMGRRIARLVKTQARFTGIVTPRLLVDLARQYGVDEMLVPEAVVEAMGILKLRA